MTERKLQRNRRGFTLTEVLLALAILIILLALAMIPISRHQRNIRQTELDSKAETIYLAAQNRLSQLQASGRSDEYGKDRATALNNIPWDAEQDKYTTSTLYYVTSAAKSTDTSAAGSILPREQVEAELWDANWVIEYDPGSGSVYAVFYSEKPMQYSFDAFNPLRSRDRRVQEGATVGYYGGDSVQSEDTGKLTPKMEIINKERLLLKVTCDTPRDPLHFYVTVTDAQGHSTGRMELTGSEVNVSYRTYTVTMVLDDLTEGKRFSQQRRFRQLTPGSDLTLKVEVESDSRLVDSVTGKLTTNSLFAEVRDGGTTAVVTYARHLQNLDEGSGLPTAITRALQEQDIQFVNTGMDDGWDSCYPGRRFTPIYNENLAYYDSTVAVGTQSYHPVIYELPVDTDGDGGLFESFRGTLRNIRLCGAQISAGGNAGGLAGSLRGGTTIEGCQVYLSPTRDKLSSKNEQDIWISGATAGGLVGRCGYDLTVRNSFASTVLEGGRCAGGLVGYISGTRTVYVERSYADCYLYASGTTGGLIGSCIGTADITLRDCYTAGFQEADVMAGLVGGELSYGDVVDTCYSASARLNGSEKLTYSTAKPADVTTDKPDITSTYYMSHGDHDMDGTVFADYEQWSGRNRADAIEKYLNDAFTAETGGSDTVAYNLVDGMGLGAYSYPRLMGLTHYGDWQAQFEAGTLVYYEVYSDGSYGFRGANKSTVKTTGTVVGDGYGMVYSTLPEQDLTVRYSLGGREVTSTLYRANAIDMGGGYYLLPLPRTLVNTTEVSTDFYRRVQVEDTTYYFNPHFTCWVSEGSEAPEAPSEIGIRTARQLNNLSLYYEQYSPLLAKDTTLQQERSIDYSGYDWANYGRSGAAVTSQQPIGSSAVVPFTHIYDGGTYPIAAVPLQSPNGGDYAGLFGLNQGSLRNVVLTTGEQDYSVTLRGILRLRTAYVGALAGRNDGTVYNCTAAGYSVTAHAYQGSVLYMGGFVGYNAGTIRSGGVSTPSLTASSNYARLLMGGFTGGNSGLVSQSYAMANVEVLQIRGGGVALSGFAGENIGSIRSSYCATALTSPGADTYGFAPATGSTSGCYYLSGGTYRFVGQVHLYDYSDQSGARAVNEQGLKALTLTGFSSADASHTYHHSKTLNTDGQAYPYPTGLTGHGSPVHYGDWVTPADLGTLGMVYWEHEEGGSNPGYHFSYIGFENGVRKDGSSLCTAHDDGGKITAYGYGYYWSKGETEPLLETQRIALDGRNTEAAAELEKQMPPFSFVTYQTSDTGLRLLSGTTGNGYWFLSQGDVWFTYTVSPFFADSYAVTAVSTGITGGTTGVEPGTDALPYQVRSVEQLQYINWSYIDSQGSTTRDVTGSNSDYKYYPYLQYTNRRGNALQTKAMALAGDSTGGPRPILTWQQTHDLNGAGHGTAADGTAANYDFHPIAGAVNNGQLNNRGNETYDLTLYNWFGGIYDGGNYYIKNVNITSHCYNVGLFGTTAGAEIKNIVLYSDNDAVIQRKTDATPASGATGPENYATSYALGGLVGIAYDYDENLKDKTKVSTISNCAIAGYTVTDNSKNRQFLGEAAIGGLVGVSSANLNRCSAVVKLNINCTHRYANTGAMNKAQWGNYVRVGGLVGGVRYDVSDCYTGGSITVANDLLNERILTGDGSNTVFVNRYETTPKAVKMTQGGAEAGPDTYVYIGGIGGSGFSATFSNFSGSKDGQPTYNNCYTYVTFPAMEGTITGISLIGSIADRAGVSGGTARLTINNCYYLDSSAAIYFGNLPTFYGKSTQSNGQYTYYSLSTLLNTDTARMDMLCGDLSYLSKYTWNTSSSPYNINGLRALSYEQMSGRADIDGKRFTALLNGGSDDGSFHWVTTEENGQSAHGKYSFPGSAAALRGQDYPFPTVLTQGTACLHYGEWPSRGLYWSSGVLSLDRITTPSVTLSLHFTQDTDADAVPVITCSRKGIVDVSVPQAQTPPAADVRHSYAVTLTGLSVGSTEVFATLGGYTARLLVSVTSTLDISVDGLPGDDFFVGDTCNLTLTARDSRGSALDVNWTVTPQHGNSVLTASVPVTKADRTASVTLTAAGEGEDRPLVTATYTVPGGETFTSQLPLIIPVRMQGVLGIANTSGEPSVYWQGVMDRDGTAFTDDVPSGAPYTDRPAYAGAKLYLYSRGSAATFDGLSVSGVTVKGGADATEYVLRPMPVSNDEDTSVLHPDVFRAENDDFRVTVGTPAKDTTSAFTYRPLTVKGRSQGQITLTVTLTDAENHAFTLSIPYTLTEEDTQVTATLRVDEQALTLSVPYGTAPAAGALSQLLTDNGISPDITQPLYADTAFTAVRKTADSGGAPTVPDADTPASGSKDPEDTPSDDPSAPDSSSSGTDPTPEPSPDTLP